MIWRLERAYSSRYPEVWRDLTNSGIGKQYDHLGKLVNDRNVVIEDPVVARRVIQLRWCFSAVVAVWLLFALALITGIGFRKL
jgi:hypothetical protein